MNIIVVDDDHDSRNTISRFLTRIGHQVTQFPDGDKAFRALKKKSVHLVFSDIHMPGITGIDLLKKIKKTKEYKDIPVVLFTGFREVNTAVEALRNGAYDYLLKPIKPEELAILTDKIAEYLSLKEENTRLSKNFEQKLEEATENIKKELFETKQAFANAVGVKEVGIFSDAMKEIIETVSKLHTDPDIPVLIEGETGTGKEVVAKLIHYGKKNITTPFIGVNCAAISPALFESELFGYEPGAFTGGNPKGQKGKLEIAAGGTIFLDEITEIPVEYQAKLLRVIQEREYYRVGGIKKLLTNARFVCATNTKIEQKVEKNLFREDLFYRLNVGRITIPPLRERKEEIIPLSEMFLRNLREQKKTGFSKINSEAAGILESHTWKGNIRELKNSMERLAFLFEGIEVNPSHLGFLTGESAEHKNIKISEKADYFDFIFSGDNFSLKNMNLEIVDKALEEYNGNKSKTAKFLQLTRNELYTYIKQKKNS